MTEPDLLANASIILQDRLSEIAALYTAGDIPLSVAVGRAVEAFIAAYDVVEEVRLARIDQVDLADRDRSESSESLNRTGPDYLAVVRQGNGRRAVHVTVGSPSRSQRGRGA